LIDKAKDSVHDATIGRVEQMVSNMTDNARDTGSNLIQMAKDNPVQAALIGLGISWLFARNKNSSDMGQSSYQPASQDTYSQRSAAGQTYGYGSYNPQQNVQRPAYRQQSSGLVEGIMDKVKENPIPAALAGVGLSMLLKGNGGGSTQARSAAYSNYDYDYRANTGNGQGGGIGNAVGQIQDKVGDVADQARDTAGDVAGQVKDVAANAASTVGDVAGTVVEKAGDVAGAVAGKAGDLAGQTTDVGGQLLKTISDNPLPAALAAVGIGWLYMNSNSSGQRKLQQAGELVGDVAGQVTDTAGDTVGNVADTVKTGAQKTQSQLHRLLLENPLAMGGLTVAAGALIGMAIPETPQEHQFMGTMRDKLVERAQSVAQNTLQKVQQTTQDVMQQVQDTAADTQANIEDKVQSMAATDNTDYAGRATNSGYASTTQI